MKKQSVAAFVLAASCASVGAQTQVRDSLRNVQLEEVEVVATRATSKTPVAFTNVNGKQIQSTNHGKDIPSLLMNTPSVIINSDAGTGMGYTGISVRGSDPTRINITANGIPMNDGESGKVYWVNTPDIASSLKDIQVQRGIGTSTNGAGAFGASINMAIANPSFSPYVSFDGSYGSFNSHKATLKASTGLLGNHWAFDVRLSDLGSDGYIDRAWVKLRSYMVQGGYFDENTSLRLVVFGGGEKTYHAWYYATLDEIAKYGRTYNSCGYMYTDKQGVDHYYDNQIDKYNQTHVQLLFNHAFNQNWNLHAALHYTRGDGYYEEYKPKASLAKYFIPTAGLPVPESGKMDLIRRKQMGNDFYGAIFSLRYTNDWWNVVLGSALNRYVGDHWGNVLSVINLPSFKGNEYYRNDASKLDGNAYLKATYNLTDRFNLYGDLQFRHIDYRINGANENFNDSSNEMQKLNIHDKFNFLNPKFGVNWELNSQNRVFASVAVAHKEPVRNNYTDNKFGVYPRAERMTDFELGYQFHQRIFQAGVNLYYMKYKDQLVLTGETNEIGESLTANVPDSYRAGVELTAGLKPCKWYELSANATFSRNRIRDFVEVVYDEHYVPYAQKLGDTPIAYSPDFIFNTIHQFTFGHFNAGLQTHYVSSQYMTNGGNENIKLDGYFVSNLDLNYAFKLPFIKAAKVGVTVYNLTNSKYFNYGYGGSKLSKKEGKLVRYDYAYYAAQAGTNFLAYLSLRF